MRPDEDVRADVHELWATVFGEPPVIEAAPSVLVGYLVESLPLPAYTFPAGAFA